MRHPSLALLLISMALTSCGGLGSYAEKEDFQSDPRYHMDFAVSASTLCEAARLVMLGDGYVVARGQDQGLSGRKEFQSWENRHAVLDLHVNCVQRSGRATLFMTAKEEHFDVRTSRQSTLIGIPMVAPISVGKSSETDNQVKTRGETVAERDFYERFYRAVQRELSPKK